LQCLSKAEGFHYIIAGEKQGGGSSGLIVTTLLKKVTKTQQPMVMVIREDQVVRMRQLAFSFQVLAGFHGALIIGWKKGSLYL